MQRVLIIGATGAGKSTLGRELRNRLRIPYIELDALHWGPAWTEREDFMDKVEDAVAGDEWIIAGGYLRASMLAWPRADCVVWLDYGFAATFGQLLRRTVRRVVTREELYAGNRETFRQAFLSRRSILWWLVKTHRRKRQEFEMLSNTFPTVAVVHLRSRREAAQWLNALPPPAPD